MSAPEKIFATVEYIGKTDTVVCGAFGTYPMDESVEFTRTDLSQAAVAAALEAAAVIAETHQVYQAHVCAARIRALITPAQHDALAAHGAAEVAKARAEQARDRALVEAANTLKTEYRISSLWLNGVEVFGAEAATPAACYQTILALRDKPAPAQTVQEAAKVVLDWWENVDQDDPTIPTAINVVEIMGDEQKTVDQFHAALRAIAGGGDE